MRKVIWGVVVLSLLLPIGAACQNTASNTPESEVAGREAYDRAALEQYVDRYMDAMLSHVPGPELFAENCRFTENGVRLPLGEGLWASMVGRGNHAFYIPDVETRQIAFIGTAREESGLAGEGDPAAIALRLKIRGGLIAEAEQLVLRADSAAGEDFPPAGMSIEKLGVPHPVYAEVIPEAERPSREELIRTANAYIENGKIRRIEAVSHKCPYGMNSGWSTYEKGMSDEAQIVL